LPTFSIAFFIALREKPRKAEFIFLVKNVSSERTIVSMVWFPAL
jgi:hypothetical protein